MAKRGRPKKKVEIEPKVDEMQEKETEVQPEPKKEEKLLRIDEVARMFGITEGCVKLWVQNSHLVSVNVGGIRMITNSSVLTCPFKRFG